MDNNNGAEWCRHYDVLALELEIEINLILDLVLALDLSLCPRSCT